MRVKARQDGVPISSGRKALAFVLALIILSPIGAALALLSMPREEVSARAWAPAESLREKAERSIFRFVRQQQVRSGASAEQLVIDVKFKNLQKIRYDRQEAVKQGVRDSQDNYWVPATIRDGGKNRKVKLRLKGALADHWEHPEKWSFLIKVGGGKTYRGMKRFSIQQPLARQFIYEWLFLKMVAEEKLLALQADFVEVIVNGDSRGIYVLEEQPGKHLVERMRYREGPIVGYDQAAWVQRYRSFGEGPAGNFEAAVVEGTQMGSLLTGSPLETLHDKAVSLLEGFRRGELAASRVFNVEEFGRLAAIYAVMGSSELDWRDLRFYFNPVTARLSPIGKEMHHVDPLFSPGWWQGDDPGPDQHAFIGRLFADPDFSRAYLIALSRFTSPGFIENFLERNAPGIQRSMDLIGREAPWFAYPGPSLLAVREQIRSSLHPVRPVDAHLVSADEGGLVIEVGNIHHFPLEVIALTATSPDGGGQSTFSLPTPVLLSGKPTVGLISYQRMPVALAMSSLPAGALQNLSMTVRVQGLHATQQAAVGPRPRTSPELVHNDLVVSQADLSAVPFLRVDEEAREIDCLAGQWELRTPLIIPAGYQLRCVGDIDWDLRDGAFVLSYSPVIFRGTAEHPIVLRSSDRTGQGLVVVQGGSESRLEWFVAQGLSIPTHRGWAMTGAITFYESDVRIENSTFMDNVVGDDMLNIFRSNFVIEDSQFLRTRADAFDSDFSNGKVSRTRFVQIGNDGLDTSGSRLEVEDVVVEGAGDKGLSFGEHSAATVRRAQITGANIGVAAKDLSRVHLEDSSIADGNIGLTALQKKPEFGAADISCQGVTLGKLTHRMLVEKGSSVSLDGERFEGTERDLREELYEAK